MNTLLNLNFENIILKFNESISQSINKIIELYNNNNGSLVLEFNQLNSIVDQFIKEPIEEFQILTKKIEIGNIQKDYLDYISSSLEASFKWGLMLFRSNDKLSKEAIFYYLDLAQACSERSYCGPQLCFLLIEELCSTLNLDEIYIILEYLSRRLNLLIKDMIPMKGKGLTFLRICNELLKRGNLLKDGEFNGQVKVLLLIAYPTFERSGLNLRGDFDLTNLVEIDKIIKDGVIKEAKEEDKESYILFWKFYNSLNNPITLFNEENFNLFQKSYKWVYNLIRYNVYESRNQLKNLNNRNKNNSNNNKSSSLSTTINHNNNSFNKSNDTILRFPTEMDLLPYQLIDTEFQRIILVQILITLQYLSSIDHCSNITFPTAAKPPVDFKFGKDQLKWMQRCNKEILDLIWDSPFGGKRFAKFIKQVMNLEVNYIELKNYGCLEYPIKDSVKLDKEEEEAFKDETKMNDNLRKRIKDKYDFVKTGKDKKALSDYNNSIKKLKEDQKKRILQNSQLISKIVSTPEQPMGSIKMQQLWKVTKFRNESLPKNSLKRGCPNFEEYLNEKSNEAEDFEIEDEYRQSLSFKAIRLAYNSKIKIPIDEKVMDILDLKKVVSKNSDLTSNAE